MTLCTVSGVTSTSTRPLCSPGSPPGCWETSGVGSTIFAVSGAKRPSPKLDTMATTMTMPMSTTSRFRFLRSTPVPSSPHGPRYARNSSGRSARRPNFHSMASAIRRQAKPSP